MLSLDARAQDLRALARIDRASSQLVDSADGVSLQLALSQAVPFRIETKTAPMRLVIDFREVAFAPDIGALDRSDQVINLRAGTIRDGWSRMVLELAAPLGVDKAWMEVDQNRGSAQLNVALRPVSRDVFDAAASPLSIVQAPPEVTGESLPVIALDPGHGGVDPGAERGGVTEADLMLIVARELREVLLRSGRYDVVLTREDDSFVSLPARVSLARAAGASVFMSLHADAIAKGRASGLTVYTLSDEASDAASANLAERQNRADIVAGVDLAGEDDQVARALIGLARQTTAPRADALADTMVEIIGRELGHLHKRPRLAAGFSVLKAPDMPSVLIELGFLSSRKDREALMDPEWRGKAATGILHALDAWFEQDALRAQR